MLRCPQFYMRDGIVRLCVKEGPTHLDSEFEFEIGDWDDAQHFVNKLQRCIFMKDSE